MYILSDGKTYVMENPLKIGEYLSTTSPVHAKEFSYKQARALIQSNRKKWSWMKQYHLIGTDEESDTVENSINYRGKANTYNDSTEFDMKMLNDINNEAFSILELAAWDKTQLHTYRNLLGIELGRCDSAVSDIEHALQTYNHSSGGKKPQAHKMAKIGYLLAEIRDKHEKIKQAIRYVEVMQQAIDNQFTLEKLKYELSKAKFTEYKGRTKYYQVALDTLGGGKSEL